MMREENLLRYKKSPRTTKVFRGAPAAPPEGREGKGRPHNELGGKFCILPAPLGRYSTGCLRNIVADIRQICGLIIMLGHSVVLLREGENSGRAVD